MEVDITEKVARTAKIGAAVLLITIVALTVGIFWQQGRDRYFIAEEAEVVGNTVDIRAKVEGKITELLAAEGETVTEGAVIARVAVNVTEEQLAQLEETLRLSQRNLAEVEKGREVKIPTESAAAADDTVTKAAEKAKRMQELFEMGAVSAVKRDEAQAAYEVAKATAVPTAPNFRTVIEPSPPEVIEAAKIQVRQAEAALAAAKQDAGATEITAPVSGAVYFKDTQVDKEIKPGEVIAGIGDAGTMRLEVKLPIEAQDKILLGQLVSYRLEGADLQGTVQEIITPEAEDSDEETGEPPENFLRVRVSIPSQDLPDLKPGLKTTLKFHLR
ncbi:MAG: HlyD family efflux transporter periplasmic adaptor subunit [Selenomonadaceae bacterium]|nr:HlyD family efflux transporter periplasmic adaptor subunit [Selenomonadaceae bacterium]